MSSRALRKLQREQAEQEIAKQVASAKAEQELDESDDDEDDEPIAISKPRNAFDVLNDADEAEDPDTDEEPPVEVTGIPTEPAQPSRPKKKKKKQKKKAKSKISTPVEKEESGDEIDKALRELAARGDHSDNYQPTPVHWEAAATKLLSINQKNLNPKNEMRSLFGNIALETDETPTPPRTQRRREVNLQGGTDIATALTGRYSVASRGKELGALADRKNCFMQGKKEWPLATSGGLSMEFAPTEGFEKNYNILHNQLYQNTQMHFKAAVESMQAGNMIGLLVTHPYHVATLLQVSEIMKHQGDHSVSGDLLERALFTIGRSVHSSFPAALRDGTARLDFDKPANRDVYMSVWRYIRNLEQRGTWRTAFEWSKVLLQFSTLSDPYGMTLVIDQLALRGRQHKQLLELTSDEGYGQAWSHLPNIQISLTLAYIREKRPRDARKQLAYAMHHYPYILSALASSLEIQPLPEQLWGKLPSSEAEKLYTELYVTRAKDLWNTPETTALIDEVANTLSHYESHIKMKEVPPALQISLEEARHVMLLEIPSLIALLPRKFTIMPTSSSDVLPPPSSTSDFTIRAPNVPGSGAGGPVIGANAMQALFNAAGTAAGAPIAGANSILQRVLNWFHAPAGPDGANENGESEGQAAFRAMREHLGGDGVPDEVFENMIRMHLAPESGDEEINADDLAPYMAGGWDYYDDLANADSGEEDSMPDLEDVPRNPHAAMVEEANEDEDDAPRQTTTGRAILRRADSSDEGDVPHPGPARPPPSRNVQQAPSSSTMPAGNDTTTTGTADPGPDGDPQRIQRYLLTTGLILLQSDASTLPAYVLRLKALRKQQQDWLVGIVRQRGGKDLADRVENAL
ncbi:hypothetical protein R6Q59_010064 [Mikania micrantha]